jgi:hypothetical protein
VLVVKLDHAVNPVHVVNLVLQDHKENQVLV